MPFSTDPLPSDLITTNKAAKIVHRHIGSVYRWIFSGRLRAWRLAGRQLRVSESELRELFEPVVPREPIPGFESRREQRKRQEWTNKVLRDAGLLDDQPKRKGENADGKQQAVKQR